MARRRIRPVGKSTSKYLRPSPTCSYSLACKQSSVIDADELERKSSCRSPEQLSYVDSFVAHTQVFGEMLEFVMKRLPNDRSMSNVVVPYLRELGARHCTRMVAVRLSLSPSPKSALQRKGFRDAYWDVMANAMSECFADWDKVTKEKTTRAKEVCDRLSRSLLSGVCRGCALGAPLSILWWRR